MSSLRLRWGTARRWRIGAIGATAAICASLGLALSASGQVSVGHSGWTWGNPKPQGNTLSGLDFAGPRGYASGAFGTLLRTDDAGATWTGVRTGITDSLVRVRVIDANTVVVGGRCSLRRSDDGGQSFTRLPWTASDRDCPSQIASFFFSTPQVGYLLTADGSIFRTDDGGSSFSRQTSVPGTESTGGSRLPTDIFFTSETAGVAITAGNGGKVFRTTDSGNSWVDVAGAGGDLNGLFFASPTTGYAVGSSNTMLRTDDAGATWASVPLDGIPGGLNLDSLDCTDPETCLIAEKSGARVIRTTDGGATGTAVSPSTQPVFAAAFSSPTRAVAVGERGATVVSDDGGQNWSPIGGAITGTAFGRLRASTPQIANAGGANGALARTTDGGATWRTIGVPTTASVRDASFVTADAGFALDSAGGAFRTANGGSSWQILNTGAPSAPQAILATTASQLLLVGPTGLRRSTDGGGSFESVDDKDIRNTRLENAEAAGNAIVTWGDKAIRLSTDGGRTWGKVRLPIPKERIGDVDFVSPDAGFALTRDGRLFRTVNRGRKWSQLPAVGTEAGSRISFSTRNSGFVDLRFWDGSEFAHVLHTDDGGRTWQPQLISQEPLVDIWDTGETAFAATAGGSFYSTRTAGVGGAASTLKIKQVARTSRPLARKAQEVKIAGTLSPAEGGEEILVSYRGSGGWRSTTEVAASNGNFTSTFRVKKGAVVVAQWIGDDERAGAGSTALKIPPRKPNKPQKPDKPGN